MHWQKLGMVVTPDPDVWWMSHYAGPSFVRVCAGSWEIFVTGRDSSNVSRIGRVTGRVANDGFQLESIDSDPVFDVGPLGTFDESGVSYPWIVATEGHLLMYYVGWVSGGLNRFQNFTGVAVSNDDGQSWERVSLVPLLDRSDADPFGTGSCCVFREGSDYAMYYTAFLPWVAVPDKNRPTYHLKRATSSDGFRWTRTGEVVVDFACAEEYVIGKPCLFEEDGVRHLWYSYRGDNYRIGYARSDRMMPFVRRDELVGISTSDDGFDSESVEYAHIFRSDADLWMIYNGNEFGRTGLGLARLEGGLLDD